MTVVVTAVFHPNPGAKDHLVEVLRATMPAVHEEPGCLLYAIHDADDGSVTMIEKWATRADLDAHSTGTAVAPLREAADPLLARPTVVTTMTPIPVGDAAGAL